MIFKVIIAVVSAVAGVVGANAMNVMHYDKMRVCRKISFGTFFPHSQIFCLNLQNINQTFLISRII